MQTGVKIGIDVEKADFSQAEADVRKFARDTGKILDPVKRQKLEMNVAEATVKLQKLRQDLKDFQGTITQKKQLIIDTNNAQSNLTEAKRKLQNFVNTGDESMSRLQRKFDGIGQSLKNLVPRVVILSALKRVGQGILGLTNNLEQNTIAFTSMLGSEEKAQDLLKQLSAFAQKTPFTITGIRGNAKQLLAMGVATENLLPTLKMLGDISAGLSVPLDRLTLAYGQVLAKGRLQGGELKQFLEAGVPIVETMYQQLGITSAEFYKMVEAGQISSVEVTKALESMTTAGGDFNDLMIKQSKSIGGLRSNLSDIIIQVGEKIGTKLLPGMKSFVLSVLDTAQKYGDAIASVVGELAGTIGGILKTAGQGISSIFDTVNSDTAKAVDQQITFTDVILGTIKAFTNGLKVVVFAIQSIGKILGSVFGTISVNLGNSIKNDINAIIKGINFLGTNANKIFGTKFKKIGLFETSAPVKFKDEMKSTFTEIGNDFNNLSIQSLKTEKTVGGSMGAIGKIDLSKLNSAIKETTESTGGLSDETKQTFKDLDEKIKDSEGKREDYQKEIEKTQQKIKDLKDEATKDIEDINRELKQLGQSGGEELANRFTEVQSELDKIKKDSPRLIELANQIGKSTLEQLSSNAIVGGNGEKASEVLDVRNLLDEIEFIQQNTTQELRNQAVEYDKLTKAQQIYKDNQKEIGQLTERQNIDKALLNGTLKQTDAGIGIVDSNDPSKIVAITDLKNQQYAIDLLNKANSYQADLQLQYKKAEDELVIYTKLQEDKLKLEQNFTREYGLEVEKQKVIVQGLIDRMYELARARSKAGMSSATGNQTTNTQTNTFNVNNNVDVSAVVNTLNNKIR